MYRAYSEIAEYLIGMGNPVSPPGLALKLRLGDKFEQETGTYVITVQDISRPAAATMGS